VTRPDYGVEEFFPAQLVGLAGPGSGTEQNPEPYVAAGQLHATYVDPRYNSWETFLDDLGFGQPVKEIDPLDGISYIIRDENGLAVSLFDPLGRVTEYAYNCLPSRNTCHFSSLIV
jgi:hypothetical protein